MRRAKREPDRAKPQYKTGKGFGRADHPVRSN